MDASEACDKISEKFGPAVSGRKEFRGEHTLLLRKENLREVAGWCRDVLGFDYLVDICSVDHLGDDPRFEINYELYSMAAGARLRLKIFVAEEDPLAPTVSDLWPTADWHEREIWDMMGIRFEEHPDLRRILMWEGYPYHPLRKDFPLEGRPSEMPDVAFSNAAPLAGGPFVTSPTPGNTQVREPRARRPGDPPPEGNFVAEP